MKNRIILCIAIVAMLTSCAGLTQVTAPQSTINYIGSDFETERFVEYSLTKTYILGIGGMSEKARNTNIVDELMKKADLQPNETLAYITISKNINSYIFITDVKYTASGYVVRPIGEYEDPSIILLGTNEQRQLYNSYKRRINHALSAEDVIKIKNDIDKDVASGKINKDMAKPLYENLAKWLQEH